MMVVISQLVKRKFIFVRNVSVHEIKKVITLSHQSDIEDNIYIYIFNLSKNN